MDKKVSVFSKRTEQLISSSAKDLVRIYENQDNEGKLESLFAVEVVRSYTIFMIFFYI